MLLRHLDRLFRQPEPANTLLCLLSLATSNDAIDPTPSELADIAGMTFDTRETFHETMKVIESRLNDKGKNWRHVLKSLMLLDYLLHEGSAGVVTWCRRNAYLVRTLCEFQYVDDLGHDCGQQGEL